MHVYVLYIFTHVRGCIFQDVPYVTFYTGISDLLAKLLQSSFASSINASIYFLFFVA